MLHEIATAVGVYAQVAAVVLGVVLILTVLFVLAAPSIREVEEGVRLRRTLAARAGHRRRRPHTLGVEFDLFGMAPLDELHALAESSPARSTQGRS